MGSRNQAAQFPLKDSKGRVRGRLIADANDEVRPESLDDTGTVTARFPR